MSDFGTILLGVFSSLGVVFYDVALFVLFLNL